MSDREPIGGLVTSPVRVLVVDDHEVVRHGVCHVLGCTDDLVVCGTAAGAAGAVDEAMRLLPDVVVMDVRLRDGCGIEAAREIRARLPGTKVMMLTSFDDEQALLSSILAGASGYHLKGIAGCQLIESVRAVAAGQSSIEPGLVTVLLDRLRRAPAPVDQGLARLSERELRVLGLVAEGLTNKEIATKLFLSDKTVKNHVASILAKLGFSRRAEAATYLGRHGHPAPIQR